MTITARPMYTIAGQDFEVDELVDIVNHGANAGWSGFIYTKECVERFSDHDDEIMDYLTDWYVDSGMSDDSQPNVIGYISAENDCESIDALKVALLHTYLEVKAHDELISMEHPDFY